ncbi:hypothetical protein C8A00DRAFT_35869 [Chaetomidium leptoderma]|uniref:Uncharacterized protein n=1 Tax=Chaetomidium leptoderma TaxID=669021 RepID=A0AAN6VHM7_9PEZI|nr:hypothetical protein C8A00DRAFT_35869 [Chaetomidium leptoderma]
MEDTDQTDPDLLLLSLNLSDSEPEEAAAPPTSSTSGPTSEYQPTRAERTALSEEAFQALKQTYRPKIENGNIHQTIPPLSSLSENKPLLSKPEAQELLHAAEELYFFRRYADAASFLRQVLDDGERKTRIDGETRWLLGYYLVRCVARLEEEEGRGG